MCAMYLEDLLRAPHLPNVLCQPLLRLVQVLRCSNMVQVQAVELLLLQPCTHCLHGLLLLLS